MIHNYESAYAYYAPIFRRQWLSPETTLGMCFRARADITETLALHKDRTAYAGKLWAELDAVRERIARLQRVAA